MKIALVILHADPSRGGAERYTVDIAAALSARGEKVSLLASSFANNLPPNLQTVQFNLTGPSKTRRYIQFLDQLDTHLRDHSYDVVHAMLPVRQCDLYHPHAGLAVAAVKHGHEKHSGITRPVAGLLNQLNPKRRRFAAVERALIKSPRPPLVICLSECIRQAVQEYFSVNESNLVTLINAVDLQRFDPAKTTQTRESSRQQFSIAPDQTVALIVAQDFARKGVREAITALPRVENANLHLLIVGKDDARPYEKLAASLGVADRVRFAGPAQDVYPYYLAADFFLLPTKHDPCSLVVLEAMAMGLPVISTKQNGATDVMENGVDGIVLENGTDIDALAATMQKLCDQPTRERMHHACIARRARLSFERHMEQLLHIYETVQMRKAASNKSIRPNYS